MAPRHHAIAYTKDFCKKIQIGEAAIKYYYNALSSGSFSGISATNPALANAL